MSRSPTSHASFVLDGQGIPSSTSTQTILTAQRDAQVPLANSILLACHQAFLHDFDSLSVEEQRTTGLVPEDFTTPTSLLELPLRSPTNAIVANVHLYLVQLLRYLARTTRSNDDDYSQCNIYGFSSGMLAATVIACSKDIPSCVSHAVSTFRLAFWLGLRSHQYASKTLHSPPTDGSCDSTWNLVIFGSTGVEVQEAIDRYTTANVSSNGN